VPLRRAALQAQESLKSDACPPHPGSFAPIPRSLPTSPPPSQIPSPFPLPGPHPRPHDPVPFPFCPHDSRKPRTHPLRMQHLTSRDCRKFRPPHRGYPQLRKGQRARTGFLRIWPGPSGSRVLDADQRIRIDSLRLRKRRSHCTTSAEYLRARHRCTFL